MASLYQDDLAYIHDAGFGDFARDAAPGILDMMASHGVRSGLVVDLGCGSGILTAELLRAGYEALGVDASPAMITLAKKRAPNAKFVCASLTDFKFPPCGAVLAVGEPLSYAFSGEPGMAKPGALLHRIRRALRPGGLLIFDVAAPAPLPELRERSGMSEGKDWTLFFHSAELPGDKLLRRRIITFRKTGALYGRSEEVHELRLFTPGSLVRELTRKAFEIRLLRSYGALRLRDTQIAFLCVRPTHKRTGRPLNPLQTSSR